MVHPSKDDNDEEYEDAEETESEEEEEHLPRKATKTISAQRVRRKVKPPATYTHHPILVNNTSFDEEADALMDTGSGSRTRRRRATRQTRRENFALDAEHTRPLQCPPSNLSSEQRSKRSFDATHLRPLSRDCQKAYPEDNHHWIEVVCRGTTKIVVAFSNRGHASYALHMTPDLARHACEAYQHGLESRLPAFETYWLRFVERSRAYTYGRHERDYHAITETHKERMRKWGLLDPHAKIGEFAIIKTHHFNQAERVSRHDSTNSNGRHDTLSENSTTRRDGTAGSEHSETNCTKRQKPSPSTASTARSSRRSSASIPTEFQAPKNVAPHNSLVRKSSSQHQTSLHKTARSNRPQNAADNVRGASSQSSPPKPSGKSSYINKPKKQQQQPSKSRYTKVLPQQAEQEALLSDLTKQHISMFVQNAKIHSFIPIEHIQKNRSYVNVMSTEKTPSPSKKRSSPSEKIPAHATRKALPKSASKQIASQDEDLRHDIQALCISCQTDVAQIVFSPCHHCLLCEFCSNRMCPVSCPSCQTKIQVRILPTQCITIIEPSVYMK